ncbi:hypothetical protein SH501x_003655 [Pirellulaceae bacterium SH501]
MKVPSHLKDLLPFPLEKIKEMAQLVGQPQWVSAVKEAVEKVGGKDPFGPGGILQFLQQASRWAETMAEPFVGSGKPGPQNAGVNGTGELFSSRWTNGLLPQDALASQLLLAGHPSEANRVSEELRSFSIGLMGGIDAIVVSNTASAIAAVALGQRNQGSWVLPRVDCVRPFRFGVSSASSLRAILDETGVIVNEVGSNHECLRSDWETIAQPESVSVLTATPGGTADPESTAQYLADLSQWVSAHSVSWIEVLFNGSLHSVPEHASLTSVIADRWHLGMEMIIVPCDAWIGGPECCLLLTRKKTPRWDAVQRVVQNLGLEASMMTQSVLLKALRATEGFEGWQRTPAAQALSVSPDNLKFRGEKMASQLTGLGKIEQVNVIQKDCRVGMGVWSSTRWKSTVVQVRMSGVAPSELAKRLAENARPIWCQVQSDCIELVLRTIDPDEDRFVTQRLSEEAGATEARTESESWTNSANTESS